MRGPIIVTTLSAPRIEIVMMPVIQAEVLRPNSAVVATSDMRSAPFISVTGTA